MVAPNSPSARAEHRAEQAVGSRQHQREWNAQHERDQTRRERAEHGEFKGGCGLGRRELSADLGPRRTGDQAGKREEEEEEARRGQQEKGRRDSRLAHTFSNPAPARIACPCEERTNAMNSSAARRWLTPAIEKSATTFWLSGMGMPSTLPLVRTSLTYTMP